MAAKIPEILPKPHFIEALKGSGAEGPLKAENWAAPTSAEGQALKAALGSKLPKGLLPAEGYLLEVQTQGALVLAGDQAGILNANRTLTQLKAADGSRALCRVADWPDYPWRAFHLIAYVPYNVPIVKRIIHEVLAPAKANTFILEIDYNFAFKSHPEMAPADAWTKEQVREVVAEAAAEGIRVIPEVNSLGHQSWRTPPDTLVKTHPEFEEPPDLADPKGNLSSSEFYCRSWCPSNPDLYPFLFDLYDELIDAFQSKAFHVGMDEVFVIASSSCPRCKGRKTADLYAKAVRTLHEHLASKGQKMLMWGDRLLSANMTGYGDWEASSNGTEGAIDLIPKDILVCDWHYTLRGDYPSLEAFQDKGFAVLPTTFESAEGARAFMEAGRNLKASPMAGAVASVWFTPDQMAGALFKDFKLESKKDDKAEQKCQVALQTLRDAWNMGK